MQSPRPRQLNDKSGREGQAAILLAIMVSSFLMFFMFAVNTGLLINAKISVQTAADAAAYAGAAAQARQLNAISYLNYDMRRQFKKFAFRNAYVGSIGSPRFPPADIPDNQDYTFMKLDYSNGTTPEKLQLKVPVVCVPISADRVGANDDCISVNNSNTAYHVQNSVGLLGSLNAISQAYLNSSIAISEIENSLCKARSGINVFIAMSWLFRGSLDEQSIDQLLTATATTLTPADNVKIKEKILPLVQGLGLFPRNVINLMRIETLKDFINDKPANIDWEGLQALENATGADAHERTILAYKSALGNLNSSVFDAEKTRLEELQPAKMLELDEVKASFKVFVQAMVPNPLSPTINDPIKCKSYIYPIEAKNTPVGVRLSPSGKNVFYAVRLRTFVKPRGLLFMQGSGELELDAMAAAKPFGSRVGPKGLSATEFVVSKTNLPLVNGQAFCTSDCSSPNLKLANDNTNFFNMRFMRDMHALAGGASPSTTKILYAQRHATAPNPTEVGLYNILPPTPSAEGNQDPMAFEFIPFSDPASVKGDPQVYRFYAPVFPKGGASTAQKVDQFLEPIFPSVSVTTDPIGLDLSNLRGQLKTSLTNYIESKLSTGGRDSENGETETFAAIELPIQPSIQSKPYLSLTAKEVRTSWSPDHHKVSAYEVRFTPRFGYSVKLVSFRDLMRQGLAADDEDVEKMSH